MAAKLTSPYQALRDHARTGRRNNMGHPACCGSHVDRDIHWLCCDAFGQSAHVVAALHRQHLTPIPMLWALLMRSKVQTLLPRHKQGVQQAFDPKQKHASNPAPTHS